ncbi:hypothetical protein [Dactylosporangium cerinum]
MNLDDQLHGDLRAVAFPADLVPPARLADTVLRMARRRRRTRVVVLGAAVAVTAALVVPAVLNGERAAAPAGTGATPTVTPTAVQQTAQDPPVPASAGGAPLATPGGGPQAIHVYTEGERSFLLDPGTGRYVSMPFAVVLSPDLTRAAVNDNGRVGIADRAALTRDATAVQWLDVPPGNGPSWSPDGTALLWTSITKDPKLQFTAHRIDVATRHVTNTTIPMPILGATVGWAADSRRYLALLIGPEANDSTEPGALQYLDPDGTLGARIAERGGMVDGAAAYSPSRRYVFADASGITSAQPLPSPVLDTASGQVVALVPARTKPVGWYDDTTLVRLTPETRRWSSSPSGARRCRAAYR